MVPPRLRACLICMLVLQSAWSCPVYAQLPAETRQSLLLGDYDSAIAWLENASEAGDAEASIELAKLYRLGRGVPKDLGRAVELLLPLAAAGNIKAQELLEPIRKRLDVGQPGSVSRPAVDVFQAIRDERDPLSWIGTLSGAEVTNSGVPVLVFAVRQDRDVWVRALSRLQPALTAVDAVGNTALHHAALLGKREFAQDLLKQGADIHTINDLGEAPLHLSIGAKQAAVTELLLQHGANRSMKNHAGWSAQMLAERLGDPLLISTDNARRSLRAVKRERGAIFHYARVGNLEAVRAVASERGSISMLDSAGDSPLSLSIKHAHDRVAIALLDLGADSGWRDDRQLSLVHLAAAEDRAAVIAPLLSAGVPLDAVDKAGKTALLAAIENGSDASALVLLESGADASLVDTNHSWPMLAAVRRGRDGLVRALLDRHPNLSQIDTEGRSALWWAIRSDQPEIAQQLLDSGARATADSQGLSPLHLAVQRDSSVLIERLASKDAVDQATGLGNTPLMLAAHANAVDAVRLLLSRAARVDAQNVYGETPLLFAVKHHARESAQALIAAGASVRVHNRQGQSARDLIEEMNDPRWSALLDQAPGLLSTLLQRIAE
ncbi:MAG: ankyrin repeat domain-containing protein [Pseudomonadales bacterium]